MAAKLRFNLLGGVEMSGSDVVLSARALALIGYLVTHAETPQPRGHLADVLWPESSSAQARTNLRRELHHLRAALNGSGALEVTGAALAWRKSADCEVDVITFSVAQGRALAALAAGEDGAGAEVRRALASYGGDFLPGCYDDWAMRAQESLQDACVQLCDRAVLFHEQRGDLEEAVSLVRRRIGLRPLEESGYRALMQLQHEAGDRAGAMRTYHRCASVLEQELALEPSLETRQLLGYLMSEQSSAARPLVTDAEPTLTAWTSTELVGREEESLTLSKAWSTAPGASKFVLVTGEAGVGKTRLVGDLTQLVRRQGGVAASAGCFAATTTLPLAPVAEWLRDPQLRRATARLDAVWRTEVERLVPGSVSSTDTVAAERAKVDAWQRLRFFEGLARAVLTVGRPLLLVVEDLHWCDTATLSWLSFLMSFPTSAPLLVVGTAREEELRPREGLRDMETAGQLARLPLKALSVEATAELAKSVTGQTLTEDELGLVHSVTAGNPFYVIEALREAHASTGSIDPADLGGVLGKRLARVPDPARQVLQLASAVGGPFTLELLAEASDQSADAVVEAVDDLWRRRILVQRGDSYAFGHSLLREAAYATVTPARRWLLHRRLAQALELLYSARLDSVAAELAEQYDKSGQGERAIPFYDRAARQATSVFAHADAVRLWQRARELLAGLPVGRQRDERELAIIEQLLPPLNAWRGYSSKELEASGRRSHALGLRLGRDDVRAAACIALFTTTFVQGHTIESNQWAEQALVLVEHVPDLAGQAHMAFAGSALSLGQMRGASEHFALACELAGERDSLPIGTRTEVHARCWWAHGLWLLGDETAAVAATERAEQLARTIEHPYSLAVALSYAAITHQLRGDLTALQRVLEDLTEVCERYEFAYYREWATVLTGWLHGGEAGIRMARQGVERLEQEGSLARMPYWLWLVAELHRGDGDTAAALGILDAADAIASNNRDVWWLPEVLRSRAALSPTMRALVDLRRGVTLARQHESLSLLERCATDLAQRLA
ncbi:MAG: AAA family ATPase [Marmoricola sp.]